MEGSENISQSHESFDEQTNLTSALGTTFYEGDELESEDTSSDEAGIKLAADKADEE